MRKIRITAGNVTAEAELNDSMTSGKIWEELPLNGKANRWGKEIYFTIPVRVAQEEDARADVEPGEIGYWPVGRAFCIFWGPTPVSLTDKPKAASPVNVLGKIIGDPMVFDKVMDGDPISIKKA